MSQVDFDENLARSLEKLYSTADVLRRRSLVREALGVSSGDATLDVGCGPGFYVRELLDEVGPRGRVVGVDRSPQMLAVAAKRTEGHGNVEFRQGEAIALPVEDRSFDRVLCVQVLEYVDDATGALAEIRRVLRPGGRVVVWDVDWSSVSWHSENPSRMASVLSAWDGHLVHPALPRTMAARLSAAGFSAIEVAGHAFVTNHASRETYGGSLLGMVGDYVRGRPDAAPPEDVAAWAAEQRSLDEKGEFYFSVVQCCFTAERPPS